MKTITLDCRMINMSGIGRYLKSILHIISASNYFSKINILAYSKDFDEIKKIVLIEYEFIEMKSAIFTIQEQIELHNKIPICDIFWSPQYNIPIFPIRAKKRIVTIHDVYQLAYFRELSLLKKVYIKTMFLCNELLSDYVLTDSIFSKSEIMKFTRIPDYKITVMYLAVEDTFLENVSNTVNMNRKFILYVGNIKPHKNLRKLIEAYKLLPQEYKVEYRLVLVGKKDGFLTGENDISDEIKHFESEIIFTGLISDSELKFYYKNASIVVLPSLYEGFGYPILEAMAFNTRVIASSIASLPEVGGNEIKYFNPYDSEDIKNLIISELKNCNVEYNVQPHKFSFINMKNNYTNFLKKV